MRRTALALAALLAPSCASSGTLTVTGHMPSQFDAGTVCGTPVLFPMVSADPNLRVVISWSGASAGRDSVYGAPGSAFSFSKSLPPGTYTVSVRSANSAGYALCDATVTKNVLDRPANASLDP